MIPPPAPGAPPDRAGLGRGQPGAQAARCPPPPETMMTMVNEELGFGTAEPNESRAALAT
jgi:hypothetical protein